MSDKNEELIFVPQGGFNYDQPSFWDEEAAPPTDQISASLGIAALVGKYETPEDLLSTEAIDILPSPEETQPQGLDTLIGVEEVDDLSDFLDDDEYLTPYDRKQKAISNWLTDILEVYDHEVNEVKQIPKKSKRDRQREFVDRRFKKQFESYTEDGDHIVYDAEALAIVLDNLAMRPSVAGKVVESAVEYLNANSVEFAGNAPAFAELIRQSLDGKMNAHNFDRMLTAMYEKIEFLDNPHKAVALQVGLAHAVFETTEDSNQAFYEKILDIAYLRNNIIPDKEHYASALEGVAGSRILEDSPDHLIAESANARIVFSQVSRAYGYDFNAYFENILKYGKQAHIPRVFGHLVPDYSIDGVRDKATTVGIHDDFFQNPQYYDRMELFALDTGEPLELPFADKVIPERWRTLYTNSDLYKKRIEQLAPRALAKDLLVSTVASNFAENVHSASVLCVPVSPGLTVDFLWFVDKAHKDITSSQILSHFMVNHGHDIDYDLFEGNEERNFASAFQNVTIRDEEDNPILVGMMIVRKSVPEDLKNVPKESALSLSLLDRVQRYTNEEEVTRILESKRERIRANRHNYFGRRPVLFKMPNDLKQRGFESVDFRQHEDRKRIVVTAHHIEGDVSFYFDSDFNNLTDDNHIHSAPSSLKLAFEDLVLSLAAEWVCRPVVETSEGKVSIDDTKSRVNLGFLRFLPVGAKPSPRQAKIFKLEQRGNLNKESIRRAPLDHKGLGRNSTYVRETYDPKVPPIEVYYDVDLV